MKVKQFYKNIQGLLLGSLSALILVTATNSHAVVGELLWQENFDSLDTNTWHVDVGDGCQIGLCGWGNQELQWYHEDNLSIETISGEGNNKALVITAKAQNMGGRAFTSGKVSSKNKLAIHYGMIETRIKVPDLANGLWPAAWLLGTSSLGWPAKGEIDMMEMGHRLEERQRLGHGDADINSFVGSNLIFYADEACSPQNPNCVAGTAWDVNYNKPYVAATPLNDRFVIYRTYWDQDSIRFTIVDNGVEHDLYQSPFMISEVSSEFQQPFYLLLNLAVGGNFTDAALNHQVTATLPAQMAIDYIRVYQYKGQGEVLSLHNPPAATGRYGVFTDTTETDDGLEVGLTADIYIWDPHTVNSDHSADEGDNVIAWWNNVPGHWFGGGIAARQPVDLSLFDAGYLQFRLKAPADLGFKIGITDSFGHEQWTNFPANVEQYGLVRDGLWSTVRIPVSDLRGSTVDLQSLFYSFAIASIDNALPSSPFELVIDDIVYFSDPLNGDDQGDQDNSVELRIEAEDYNNYFDTSAGNAGGAYRTDNVDIEQTSDIGGGVNVGWTDSGEWLEYNIWLAAGSYELTTRVASALGGGAYQVSINGQPIASDTVANTGGWQAWESHQLGDFVVEEGIHTLRVDISSGLFNLNWLNLSGSIDSGSGDDDQDDNSSNEPPSSHYGVTQTTQSSVTFYVNRDGWADVHYTVNGDPQQNVRMNVSAGINSWMIANLSVGDQLHYWFTYQGDNGLAVDTEQQVYTVLDTAEPVVDSDGDGVTDDLDQCSNTPAGVIVDANGCPLTVPVDSDGDGVIDSEDQCPNTPPDADVNGQGCVVALGNVIPLYGENTPLETAIVYDKGDAVVTQFADRARDRHAKEDQFQSYDHYLAIYWKHRTARFKFEDYVAKGGDSIVVTFVTEWKLGAREFRAWYYGMHTVAEYHGNYQNDVIEVAKGTFDDQLNAISSYGDQYKYQVTITENRGLNGSINPLAIGQKMEIEVSQFLDGVPEGRANYYGTTYLYLVGVGGMVPWYTVGDFADKSSERENSHQLDAAAWLGGATTLPFAYTNEPDNHFMQMATNLSAQNGQPFVLGRRIHHTDFDSGQHDELPENGIFSEMIGKAGPHYVNASCSGCHERNGRASVNNVGETLDKWVFKVGDSQGAPHPDLGRVLQPQHDGGVGQQGEGNVTLGAWTEQNGLRSPNYVFSQITPPRFSARIAPQLVGLGLLEAIQETDILALEDVNDADGDGISGKAQRVLDPVSGETRLGRFGYKAGTTSIKHQVAAAFNTDIGVMTSVLPDPDCGSQQVNCGNSGSELSDEHLDHLVKYIALLGVRPQRDHDDPQVVQGKNLFTNLGCAGCHTPSFQTSQYHPFAELRDQAIQPYSDLLLHDMGPGLADNLGEGLATGSEWRTAPLWGLGLSACVTGGVTNPTGRQGDEVCTPDESYLHDGRARTLEEAILWHGGEAQASNQAFQALSADHKQAVIRFLKSL